MFPAVFLWAFLIYSLLTREDEYVPPPIPLIVPYKFPS